MALINCPDCNHSVSSIAKTCPNCGYPMENSKVIATAVHELKASNICPHCGRNSLVYNEKAHSHEKISFITVMFMLVLCVATGFIAAPFLILFNLFYSLNKVKEMKLPYCTNCQVRIK